MADKDVVWFRSKVDGWFKIILWSMVLTTLGVLVASVWSGDQVAIVVALISSVFTAAIFAFLAVPVQYGIAQDELIIRFGVVRQRVRLDQIREVRPTRNPIAAPALSFDRVEIRTYKQFSPEAIISPDARDTFLTTLAERSGLRREGDRLIRETD